MSNPFNILGDQSHPPSSGQEQKEENQSGEINERIKSLIDSSDLFLFMKGSPEAPQCGFSSKASQILISCGKPFSFVDILSNPEIRANLPQFSNWPTFPQLFVNGELIGGCDIITELHEAGELQTIIDSADSE